MCYPISVYFNRFLTVCFLNPNPNPTTKLQSCRLCARSLIATGRRPSRVLLCSPGANSLLEHSTAAAAKLTYQNTSTSNTTRTTTTTTTRTPTTNPTTTTATITTDATMNNSPSSNSSNYSSPTSESSGATYYSK